MNVWCICIHWPPRLPKSIDMLCSQHWILGWWWYCLIMFTHQQWGKTPVYGPRLLGHKNFAKFYVWFHYFQWILDSPKFWNIQVCQNMWTDVKDYLPNWDFHRISYPIICRHIHKTSTHCVPQNAWWFSVEGFTWILKVDVNHFSKTLHAHTVFGHFLGVKRESATTAFLGTAMTCILFGCWHLRSFLRYRVQMLHIARTVVRKEHRLIRSWNFMAFISVLP